MTNEELLLELCAASELPIDVCIAVLDAVLATITTRAMQDKKTTLYGLGTFRKKASAQRVIRSVHSGELMRCRVKWVLAFRASAHLRAAIKSPVVGGNGP